MSILKIARMGHPVLRHVAAPVEDPTSPEIARLITDMLDTMEDANGAGLAAPQIHVPLRVVIFHVPESRSTGSPLDRPQPLTILINPVITALSAEAQLDWEGCLSVPGLTGAVPRWQKIRYTGADQHGDPIDRTVEGFHARVVQHECDHLDGMLYPQRMADLSLLTFVEEATRYPVPLASEKAEA